MNMNIENLKAIGLTYKEASLYLASLQEGLSSITELAKIAKLKRPTAYLVLEDLLHKHLIIPVPVGKLTHYKAGDPVFLAKDIEIKRTLIANILPELKYMYKHSLKLKTIKIDIKKTRSLIIEKKQTTSKKPQSIFTVNKFFFSFNKKK